MNERTAASLVTIVVMLAAVSFLVYTAASTLTSAADRVICPMDITCDR